MCRNLSTGIIAKYQFIQLLSAEGGGCIIDNNRFSPFGEPLSPVAKNSRLTNSPWGYTGESHDIEAGLVYLRARYYEPGTGRFIQQDSYPYFGEIEEPLTRNLYIYGNGNPLKYIDPSGHMNYITQSDSLMKGVFRGLGDWAKDILNSPKALVQLAKNIIFGDITIADMVSAGFADFVEKYNYVKNNIGILSPLKKASDEAVEEIGYRIGMIVGDVVISIVGAKLVSAFSKTKLGQKLVDKFKTITSKIDDTVVKSLKKLMPSEISKLSIDELKKALPDDWTFHSNGPNGNDYIHIKDAVGNDRIRIDPPDKVTPYDHIHIYDEKGNSLDINGNVVAKNSPNAHIPYTRN